MCVQADLCGFAAFLLLCVSNMQRPPTLEQQHMQNQKDMYELLWLATQENLETQRQFHRTFQRQAETAMMHCRQFRATEGNPLVALLVVKRLT